MRISIALCTYNGALFLRDQLNSFTVQTRLPDELFIVDDNSSDDTVNVAEDFARSAPFPTSIVVNEANLGSTRNFEKAISLCTGDIIALSDQDDVWVPKKLEYFESIFQSQPGTGMVFSNAALVDQDLLPLQAKLWDKTFRPRDRTAIADGRASEVLIQYNVVTGATMAFRQSLVDAILPIPELSGFIHDGWIALICSFASKVSALNKDLVLYRQHSAQQLGAGLSRWALNRTERCRLTLDDRRVALSRLDDFRKVFDDNFLEKLRSVATDPKKVPTRQIFEEMIETAQKSIEEHIEHISARLDLSSTRCFRLPEIIGEMTTGRYGIYSRGWQSAALDLVEK